MVARHRRWGQIRTICEGDALWAQHVGRERSEGSAGQAEARHRGGIPGPAIIGPGNPGAAATGPGAPDVT